MTQPTTLPDSAGSAPWLQQLATDGFIVIPNVIPKDKIDWYIEQSQQWLEKFPLGYDRNDNSTWDAEHLPFSQTGGLYNRYSVNHEDFVWKIRSEPGIINAFAELWGTSELIVSFDGINITPPVGPHGRQDLKPTEPWPHMDQNPHKPDFGLMQGICALSESGPKDGGLVVMKGSHIKHPQFFAENGGINEAKRIGAENTYRFDMSEAEWYRSQGCEEIKVEAPAGSLIMWDSRLIHWNCTPSGARTRVATYICYCPASWGTKESLAEKADIFKKRQGTTHWPARNDVPVIRTGPPLRNGVADPYYRLRPWTEPEETETVKKLAGVMAY